MQRIPRPRSFEDVASALEALSGRIETVANGQLVVSDQIGQLTAEVARLRGDSPMRDREASFHDFDTELAELRKTLKERVKDPKDSRFTSDYARAMVKGAIDQARRDDKARAWDSLIKGGKRVALSVAVGAAVGWLSAWLHFGMHP